MTHTEELVAALAEAVRHAGPRGWSTDATYASRLAASLQHAIPEARDKMLLGFAVEALEQAMMGSGVSAWLVMGGDWYELGPTPLAAVEAALKDTCLCREDAARIATTEPGASLLADAAVGAAFNHVGIRFSAAELRAALKGLGPAGNLQEGIVMVAARAAAEALDAAALGESDD